MKSFETVAAVSTPRGKGGVAVIRISGEEAFAVAERFFKPKSGRALSGYPQATAVYGDIYSGGEGSCPIDDGLATVFFAPKSFTGEDTVEISCHGGSLVTERVLEAALLSGASLAGRGEFTKRAFVNGKLRLEEVEAIGGIIEAETDAQIKLFSKGSASALGAKVDSIKSRILALLTELYAKIDYPEEDLSGIPRNELPTRIEAILRDTEALAKTYRTGYAVTSGIRTVICGRANAGKSTLYNALLGYEAAIVTDIEGTTRDVLEHTVSLGSLTLRLFDTAGLRENATDAVEQIGIERTRKAMDEAELVLAVFDSSSPMREEDRALAESLKNSDKTVVCVLSKSDVQSPGFDADMLKNTFPETVSVSAKDGKIEELKSLLEALYIDDSLKLGEDAILVGERQASAIRKTEEALRAAHMAAEDGFCEDICAMYAEAALSALSELDGREISRDIVDGIFSRFCVGK